MEFVSWTLLVTVVYYVVVVSLFCRAEVAALFSGKKPFAQHPVADPSSARVQDVDDHDARLFSAVHDLLEDLKSLWNKCKTTQPSRPDLLQALRAVVTRYPLLKGTAFAVAINNQLVLEADQFCAVQLEEEDFNTIWMG